MRFVFLILGTVFTAVFVFLLQKGKKYDYMLEAVDGDAFPLKSIYSAGLALQDWGSATKLSMVGDKLKGNIKLYYSKQFEEFYSRIIVAQIISFDLFLLALFFTFAGLFGGEFGVFFALIGIVLCALASYYFFNFTKDKIKKRQDECDTEFPDAISKMALIVNSGMILYDAWKIVAEGNSGTFYELMQQSCDEMENGKSETEAIRDFGIMTNSDEIKKFTTALVQSIERGGGDLPVFLINQSTELWKLKRQMMLQKGEKAASALLIPIALMFAGVMLIVLVSAVQSFNFGL